MRNPQIRSDIISNVFNSLLQKFKASWFDLNATNLSEKLH